MSAESPIPSQRRGSRGPVEVALSPASHAAKLLLELQGDELAGPRPAAAVQTLPPEREHLIEAAQRTLKLRQLRPAYLPTDLFGEPAWDLLLVLYTEEHLGRGVSMQRLSDASGVSKTTTLRTSRRLVADGLVECEQHAFDSRVLLHRLTEVGRRGMDRYFEALQIAFL